VAASPVHGFRYNQPIPAPNQTKPLLTRRRAFYPAERVSLSFRLPPGATLAAPLRERVVLSLYDLLGASRKVAGPGATYRLLYPNPGASRRLVLVCGGGSPAALERFLPPGRSAPKLSLFADTLVIGEDDKVVLEGYFRDGYRISTR